MTAIKSSASFSLSLFLCLSLVFQLKRLVGGLAVAQVAVESFYPSVGLAPGCWHSRISWRTHPLMCGHQKARCWRLACAYHHEESDESLMSVDSISLSWPVCGRVALRAVVTSSRMMAWLCVLQRCRVFEKSSRSWQQAFCGAMELCILRQKLGWITQLYLVLVAYT